MCGYMNNNKWFYMFHLIILEIFGKDPIRDFGFGFQRVIFDVGFGPASFPVIPKREKS
jgi:hypothetical protein